MCTVTAVRQRDPALGPAERSPLVRIICNRDEQRSRAASLPPVLGRNGERVALMPIDPVSGGTWIGANDAGLVACLLNSTPRNATQHARPPGNLRSRGEIVPAVLACVGLAEALSLAGDLDPEHFPPFRLLLIHADIHVAIESNGADLAQRSPCPLPAMMMFTSSGLGDHLVQSPRRQLFDRCFAAESDPFAAQRCFHEHSWPHLSHLSVLMHRSDARTVSQTALDVFADRITMQHALLDDDLRPSAPPAVHTLKINQAATA